MHGFHFSGSEVINQKPVSLYILTYNQECYIRDAIKCSLEQTYQPLEIIISDDFSSDMTWEIINQAIAGYKGPHNVVIRRNDRNLGISEHINKVWKHCSGDWIVSSAGDDISLPDRVERIMAVVSADSNLRLVQSWLEEVDADGYQLEINRLGSDCKEGDLRLYGLGERIKGISYAPHGAAMAYSRELVDKFSSLPKGVIFEDNIVNLRAELIGVAGVLAMPLVKHRNHANQITNTTESNGEEKIRERIRCRLDSDVMGTQQNLADIALARNELEEKQYRDIENCYRKRLRYFVRKRRALVYMWPVRLLYLVYLFTCQNVAPLSRDDVLRSAIPRPVYALLKKLRAQLSLSKRSRVA